MSRSQPENEIVNPCLKWFSWDGDTGKGLKQYNKETKKNDIIPLPFNMLILDRLTSVTGYNEPEKIGYYANEVRNMKTDKLTVRSKNGVEAEGTYEEVKAKLGTKGLDFCQSVYIAYYEGKVLTLGNIKMKGAALKNWFDFCKVNKVMEIGVNIKEATAAKKGKIEYFEPVFKPVKIKEETNNAAIEIDKELQEYLKAYLERNKTSVEQPKHETAAEDKSESKSADKAETKSGPVKQNQSNTEFIEEMNADISMDDNNEPPPF